MPVLRSLFLLAILAAASPAEAAVQFDVRPVYFPSGSQLGGIQSLRAPSTAAGRLFVNDPWGATALRRFGPLSEGTLRLNSFVVPDEDEVTTTALLDLAEPRIFVLGRSADQSANGNQYLLSVYAAGRQTPVFQHRRAGALTEPPIAVVRYAGDSDWDIAGNSYGIALYRSSDLTRWVWRSPMSNIRDMVLLPATPVSPARIAAVNDTELRVVDAASGATYWSQTIPYQTSRKLHSANLSGSAAPELLLQSNGITAYRLDTPGVLWTRNVHGAIAISDRDTNGYDDILQYDGSRLLWLAPATGLALESEPFWIGGGGEVQLALADVSGTWHREVVVNLLGGSRSGLHVLGPDLRTPLLSQRRQVDSDTYTVVRSGDVDGDGNDEVVSLGSFGSVSTLRVADLASGREEWLGWHSTSTDWLPSSGSAFADVDLAQADSDPAQELLLLAGNAGLSQSPKRRLLVIDGASHAVERDAEMVLPAGESGALLRALPAAAAGAAPDFLLVHANKLSRIDATSLSPRWTFQPTDYLGPLLQLELAQLDADPALEAIYGTQGVGYVVDTESGQVQATLRVDNAVSYAALVLPSGQAGVLVLIDSSVGTGLRFYSAEGSLLHSYALSERIRRISADVQSPGRVIAADLRRLHALRLPQGQYEGASARALDPTYGQQPPGFLQWHAASRRVLIPSRGGVWAASFTESEPSIFADGLQNPFIRPAATP